MNNEPNAANAVPSADTTRKLCGCPVGCSACGGPYPLCKDGCPIFDD